MASNCCRLVTPIRCRAFPSSVLSLRRVDRQTLLLPTTTTSLFGISSSRLFATPASRFYNQSATHNGLALPQDDDDDDETFAKTIIMFPDEILETDTYNGVTLRLDHFQVDGGNNNNRPSSDKLLTDPEVFGQCLAASLDQWQAEGRKGIWIYVPTARADLVPVACAQGFAFHMVNAQGLLILSRWLPTDTPSRLPRGPLYQVGVGCLVLHPNNETLMLAVQEITGPAAAAKLWKMPTGLADPSEDIHEAAEREMREETGLEATCDGILVFRQSHATTSRAGTRAASDLFFVCRMRLTTTTTTDNASSSLHATALTAQPEEIAAIQWMPIADFMNQEIWQSSPLYAKLNSVCWRAKERDVFGPVKLPVGFRGYPPHVTNTLYGLQLGNQNQNNNDTTTSAPSAL